MKKILCILCVLSIIALCGCTGNNKPANEDEVDYIYLSDPYPYDKALAVCSNIIRAECVGETKDCNLKALVFNVKENIMGTTNGDKINVFMQNVTEAGGLDYKIGSEYVLFLMKGVTVYAENDRYYPCIRLFFPLDEKTAVTYSGKPLYELTDELDEKSDKEEILSYIRKEAEKTTPAEILGREFIRSEDREEILEKSQYIIKVRLNEKVDEYRASNSEDYTFELIEDIKGNFNGKQTRIKFTAGTVEEGKELTVAVQETSVDFLLYLTSKNSIIE